MAGLPWPGSSELDAQSWDTLLMGGALYPGLVRIKVHGSLDVDKGKAGNKHGANLKVKGFKPRDVTIEWRIWDDTNDREKTLADWDQMQAILDELEPVTGKSNFTPVAIFNPKTAARGVYSVLVEEIDGPDWADGIMSVTLKCTEWNPPPPGVKGVGKVKTEKSTPGSEWEQAGGGGREEFEAGFDEAIQAAIALNSAAANLPNTSAGESSPAQTDTDP